MALLELTMGRFVDPDTGSPSTHARVVGILGVHVGNMCMAGDKAFYERVTVRVRQEVFGWF